jgi:23S rRNA maturation-related 3'-5' exoribonuclease YhaM
MIFFLFFFVSKSREKRRDERGEKSLGCVCVRNVGKFEENCWEKNAREGKIYM